MQFLKLKLARSGVESMPQNECQRERDEAEGQRQPRARILFLRAQAKESKCADQRHGSQDCEQREMRSSALTPNQE